MGLWMAANNQVALTTKDRKKSIRFALLGGEVRYSELNYHDLAIQLFGVILIISLSSCI
jgi:menaquinone-dependent protoporphyrinogen IX oxidase